MSGVTAAAPTPLSVSARDPCSRLALVGFRSCWLTPKSARSRAITSPLQKPRRRAPAWRCHRSRGRPTHDRDLDRGVWRPQGRHAAPSPRHRTGAPESHSLALRRSRSSTGGRSLIPSRKLGRRGARNRCRTRIAVWRSLIASDFVSGTSGARSSDLRRRGPRFCSSRRLAVVFSPGRLALPPRQAGR